jgi:hypothetical protein
MTLSRWFFLAVPAALPLVTLSVACSDTPPAGNASSSGTAMPTEEPTEEPPPPPPPPVCSDAKCAADNLCINNGTDTKCRLTCTADRGPTGCQINQTCVEGDRPDGEKAKYCKTLEGKSLIKRGPKQWGTACDPKGSEAANEACDTENGFICLAESPLIPDGAICTTANCDSDANCPGGFVCATRNKAPNADTAERSFGEVRKVCLPRAQCSTCATDEDCGANALCKPDDSGATYCMAKCARDTNCGADAKCAAFDDGNKVCFPNSKKCVGDGSFCQPCAADSDCKGDGAVCAVKGGAPFSNESFCVLKKPTPCVKAGVSDCPTSAAAGPKTQVTCIGVPRPKTPKNPLQDYCVGIVPVGTDGNASYGCFTVPRK